MVSIETGSNAGAPRHRIIFVDARVRKRAWVKGLTLRLVTKQAGKVHDALVQRQTRRCIRNGKHFCVSGSVPMLSTPKDVAAVIMDAAAMAPH